MFKKMIFVLLLTSCAPREPELDPIKVQNAFRVIGEHLIAIETKLGMITPTPVAEEKK